MRLGFLWTQLFLLPTVAGICLIGLQLRGYFDKPGRPAAPTNLVAIRMPDVPGDDDQYFELRWDHGGGQTSGFVLESVVDRIAPHGNQPATNWLGPAPIPAVELEAQERTASVYVSAESKKTFCVRAVNGFGQSKPSNYVTLSAEGKIIHVAMK